LITALIGELPKIIVTIVEAIPQIINSLVKEIADSWPQMMEAGRALLMQIVEKVPELLSSYIGAGKDIINGIIDGIKSMASAVWDAIKRICKEALNSILSFFGISSPSKLMLSLFRDDILGAAILGVNQAAPKLYDALDDISHKAHDAITIDLSPTVHPAWASEVLRADSYGTGSVTINQSHNINGMTYLPDSRIAKLIEEVFMIAEQSIRMGEDVMSYA
jgi:hypothetical protein